MHGKEAGDDAGQINKQTREFGGFKRDLKALAELLPEHSSENATFRVS